MPALRTLQLTSNKLTSVAGLGTPSISPLLTLDLSHNELPDSALPALVAFAATLVTLDLSYVLRSRCCITALPSLLLLHCTALLLLHCPDDYCAALP